MVADRVLHALRAPIQLDGREVVISASVGIAQVWPGYDTDDLLRGADAAMYEAKTGGRDRYAVYNPDMHRKALERLQLESDLRIGLKLDQLEIHYQPLINLKSNQLYGAEALVRWRHRTLGLIAPDQFIPIAEETGLIVDLGFRVLRDACMQAAKWIESKRDGIHPSFFMSVNISSRQLQDPDLQIRVARALEESGLPARHLMLEVTESVVMQRVEFALECLNGLKRLGVRLAIDDFGTGYSSLSHLQRFPFDVLKIDKSFVDGISEYAGATDKDASLVRTSVALGRALGLQVVAEGIEAGAQGSKLQALGCEIGQGFHYAHPLPPNRFAAQYFASDAAGEDREESSIDGAVPASIFVPR
jgi:predicted signal transduction protein with EAL and GGDEF domain